MTLVKSLYSGDPDLCCLTVNRRNCKCLMSMFSVERLASSIRPSTSQCSSCVLMYVHVTTCSGGSHVAGSYVDVPNSCSNSSLLERQPPRRPGFYSYQRLVIRDLQFRMSPLYYIFHNCRISATMTSLENTKFFFTVYGIPWVPASFSCLFKRKHTNSTFFLISVLFLFLPGEVKFQSLLN